MSATGLSARWRPRLAFATTLLTPAEILGCRVFAGMAGTQPLRQVRALRRPYSRRITSGMVNPCNSIENTTTV